MKEEKALIELEAIGDPPDSPLSTASSITSTKRKGYSINKSSKRRKKASPPTSETEVTDEQEYIVERVLGHIESNGKVTDYHVKWEGWPLERSTWEPIEHLNNCLEAVVEYFEKKVYPNVSHVLYDSRVETLRAELSKFKENEWINMIRKYFTIKNHIIPAVDEKDLDFKITCLARLPSCARDPKIVKEVELSLMHLKLAKEREHQVKVLQQWENEINSVSPNRPPISVVNVVDLDGPPANFFYVDHRIAGSGIHLPETPLVGCDCRSCPGASCCARTDDNMPAYGKEAKIKVPKGTPIFECNAKCKCGTDCPNRVIQKGRTIPLVIFKTLSCGWGVKTLEPIKKGQFVTEYVGEVISSAEAERRGRQYDKEGRTYLFDLDFNDENNSYTVDGGQYGNVSHFINHSCSPCLEVFAVWIECLDPNQPRLGLFASRNIKAGEEITLDYLCRPIKDEEKKRKIDNTEKKVYCMCGASNCRKFLF